MTWEKRTMEDDVNFDLWRISLGEENELKKLKEFSNGKLSIRLRALPDLLCTLETIILKVIYTRPN